MKKQSLGLALARVLIAGALAALVPGVTSAHPGEPDYHFGLMEARGTDCRVIRWFSAEQVHDAAGNTYESQEVACDAYQEGTAGPVFWSGPAH